jgi:hypothetical protein
VFFPFSLSVACAASEVEAPYRARVRRAAGRSQLAAA